MTHAYYKFFATAAIVIVCIATRVHAADESWSCSMHHKSVRKFQIAGKELKDVTSTNEMAEDDGTFTYQIVKNTPDRLVAINTNNADGPIAVVLLNKKSKLIRRVYLSADIDLIVPNDTGNCKR